MFEKRHKDAGSLEVRSVGFFFPNKEVLDVALF